MPARRLIELAMPYWEAEAEIVRRFFARRPRRDDHIFWLRAQLWKELHPVDGYFSGLHRELAKLTDLFPRVDVDVDRHHYHSLLQQMVQEFNHYVVLADILQYLLSREISAADTVQLPEEKKLQELRRRYAEGSDVERAAVLLTEGGGARMFREGRKIKGGPLERRIARAMDVIYRDERDHVAEAARAIAPLTRSRDDLRRISEAVRAISLQRVRMRNEMFRHPMTEDELDRLISRRSRRAASRESRPRSRRSGSRSTPARRWSSGAGPLTATSSTGSATAG